MKQTLDKIVYQLDLVKSSMGLLEQRITQNESKLVEMMNFIRFEDVRYVSTLDKLTCCSNRNFAEASSRRRLTPIRRDTSSTRGITSKQTAQSTPIAR